MPIIQKDMYHVSYSWCLHFTFFGRLRPFSMLFSGFGGSEQTSKVHLEWYTKQFRMQNVMGPLTYAPAPKTAKKHWKWPKSTKKCKWGSGGIQMSPFSRLRPFSMLFTVLGGPARSAWVVEPWTDGPQPWIHLDGSPRHQNGAETMKFHHDLRKPSSKCFKQAKNTKNGRLRSKLSTAL